MEVAVATGVAFALAATGAFLLLRKTFRSRWLRPDGTPSVASAIGVVLAVLAFLAALLPSYLVSIFTLLSVGGAGAVAGLSPRASEALTIGFTVFLLCLAAPLMVGAAAFLATRFVEAGVRRLGSARGRTSRDRVG